MVRSIIAASVRFRLLAVGLAVAILVLGAARLPRMHADVLPETSPTTVEVQTEAPGLSAQEVESLITVPMEHNLLDGIMGVTDVTSHSVAALSSIDLHFQPGFDVLHARQLVQERLTQAFALPNVSRPPVMLQPVSSTSRVMMIGLTSTRLSPIELSVLARWTIVPRLLGLPGVANVATFGQADRQLQVLVDPRRLAARHVTLAQVIQTAGNSQLVSPLSFLEASTPGTGGFLEGPNQRIAIRHLLPFGTPRDLGQVPVAGVSGRPLPLASVASVVQDHQPLTGNALVHGVPGLVLVVEKLPSASVPALTRAVDAALADLRAGLAGIHVDTSLFRPATYVHSAFHDMTLALIVAAALAALALLALFLDLRLAFATLAAIALSFVAATLVLGALGYSFNALVALGLLIALTVVVDEAVGAAHQLDGQAPAARVVRAYADVGGALVYATLIALLSVAPVFFSTGATARFLHPLVLAFGLAVVASMAVALTVTPALAALVAVRPRAAPPALARRLTATYWRLLERALAMRPALLVGVAAVGLAGVVAVPLLGAPHAPSFRDRSLVVHWSGAPGMSLAEMDRITARASRELAAVAAVQDVGADIGRALAGDRVVDTDSGEIWVTLRPSADYDQAVSAVRAIAAGTPGMHGTVATYESDSMQGRLGPPDRTVVARVYGQDYGTLARLAGRVRAAMSGVDGLVSPRVELPQQQPTVHVDVDLARAQRGGIKPGDVRREAATLVSGLTVGNFFEQQKVFDVVVWGTPAVRSSLTSVRDLLLDTEDGGHVRLGDVARIAIRSDPTDLQHQAISRYLDVTATVPAGDLGAARSAVARVLRGMSFPLEYHGEVVTPAHEPATSHAAFVSYAVAAMIGAVLLAQAALGSWALALAVFLLLPVSLAGGLAVALAIGASASVAADAALVAVLALAARQAIGIATHIRRVHRAEGGELTAGLVGAAASDHAAPAIAATAVLAVAALPFVALGNVAGNELPHVAAAVILGGLVSALAVNLFVLPAVCLRLAPRLPVPEPPEDLAAPEPPIGVPS